MSTRLGLSCLLAAALVSPIGPILQDQTRFAPQELDKAIEQLWKLNDRLLKTQDSIGARFVELVDAGQVGNSKVAMNFRCLVLVTLRVIDQVGYAGTAVARAACEADRNQAELALRVFVDQWRPVILDKLTELNPSLADPTLGALHTEYKTAVEEASVTITMLGEQLNRSEVAR